MAQRRQPVPPDAPPALRDLVTELRTVVDHGFASLRELEKVAHVSRSTLSEALSGRRLPSLDVVLAVVRAGDGGDEDAWRARWHATRVALLETAADPEPRAAPATDPVMSPLADPDPRKVGPFRLEGVLGSGSMGRVYLAHTTGGRAVAVKVVRAECADDPEFRRRFRREVDTARQVHGMFTAPVLDADPDAPRPWLATAYVPGPSLRQAVAEHGPLPVDSVRRLAAAVVEALRGMHAAGIVHRDLTPGNVLLAAEGPKVIDFGIAHAVDGSHLTRTGAPVGTAAFMAPEQATAGKAGPATDVFALGSLLTFATTGNPPFGEGPAEAILYRVVHEAPDLSAIEDPELLALITRCLAKDPDERPTTEDLVRQLNPSGTLPGAWLPAAVAAGLPRHVPARRRPIRVTTPTRRRLAFTAAGVAAAVLLAAGVLADITGSPQRSATGGQHSPGAPVAGDSSSQMSGNATSPGTSAPRAGGSAQASTSPATGAGAPSPPGGVVLKGSTTSTSPAAVQPGGTVAPRAAGNPPAVVPPTAKMSFENGKDNWTPFWGPNLIQIGLTTAVHWDGNQSLSLTATPSRDKTAVGTDDVAGLRPGMTVTMHIWHGGQGAGDIVPFVQDTDFNQHKLDTVAFSGGWQTVTFTVPDVSIKGIGFQIDVNGSDPLVIALDAVNW